AVSASTGPWTVAAPATLNFNAGTFNLNAGSTVSGTGTVLFSSSDPVNFADTYSVDHTVFLFGGIANFNANSSTATLTMSSSDGARLGGLANFTVTGLFTWQSGIMIGPGTTTVAATGSLLCQGNVTLKNGRHLD